MDFKLKMNPSYINSNWKLNNNKEMNYHIGSREIEQRSFYKKVSTKIIKQNKQSVIVRTYNR